MAYAAKVLADSISPDGARLTTMEVTFPRIVLAEFNTHRVFSRNSASSRAIPVEKMLKKVQEDPFIPIYWGKNQKGMQAEHELLPSEQSWAEAEWLEARDHAISSVQQMLANGIHKQITNRLLEPWLWHTVIVTATEWDNFYALRCNPDAQPEIRKVAEMMRAVHSASAPRAVNYGDWHLPLVDASEAFDIISSGVPIADLCLVSVGRCARVSYLTHDGKRDPLADVELARRLQSSGHMSPFEHVATPLMPKDAIDIVYNQIKSMVALPITANVKSVFSGNFRGWHQLRKRLADEDNFQRVLDARG